MQTKTKNLGHPGKTSLFVAGSLAALALALVLAPSAPVRADSSDRASADADIDFQITVPETISIFITNSSDGESASYDVVKSSDSDVVVDANDTAHNWSRGVLSFTAAPGTTIFKTAGIIANTNNPFGLTVSAAADDTKIFNEDEDTEYYAPININSVTTLTCSNATCTNFGNPSGSTWGLAVGDFYDADTESTILTGAEFSSLPMLGGTGLEILASESKGEARTGIVFGFQSASDLGAGKYTTTVTFTAVGNTAPEADTDED